MRDAVIVAAHRGTHGQRRAERGEQSAGEAAATRADHRERAGPGGRDPALLVVRLQARALAIPHAHGRAGNDEVLGRFSHGLAEVHNTCPGASGRRAPWLSPESRQAVDKEGRFH